MPRILSRNASLYKPKRSRACSSSRTALPPSSSCFLSSATTSATASPRWYSTPISRDEEEYYCSGSSSPSSSPSQLYVGSSTTSSVCSNSPSLPYLSDASTCQPLEQRRSIFSQTASSAPPLSLQNSSCEDDVWGHFVEPLEAEAEIIRHSKILSKLYSMQ
jgi:hypothetical protein